MDISICNHLFSKSHVDSNLPVLISKKILFQVECIAKVAENSNWKLTLQFVAEAIVKSVLIELEIRVVC